MVFVLLLSSQVHDIVQKDILSIIDSRKVRRMSDDILELGAFSFGFFSFPDWFFIRVIGRVLRDLNPLIIVVITNDDILDNH